MLRKHVRRRVPRRCSQVAERKGSVLPLAAIAMTVVLTFAAFTVDFGMITMTKGQAQNAADSAAHAAALELSRSFGPGATVSSEAAEAAARARAVEMISRFRTGNITSTAAVADRDLRFGRRDWDASAGQWTQSWDVQPFNMVEVTVRRTAAAGAPLPMTFARVMGIDHHDVTAKTAVGVAPAVGFRMPSYGSGTLSILPIAVDVPTWNALLAAMTSDDDEHQFGDAYAWNEELERIVSDDDDILELNMYPDLNTSLPPGNRGTVDLGSPNNSTTDLKRQIQYGLNAFDLSFFPDSRIQFDENGELFLNGDPGISAGIEAALKSIIGKVCLIPLFTEVSGPGNNATYTVVKFVGVRIMAVKLSGGPGNRYLTVQPAQYTEGETIVRGNGPIEYDSVVSKPYLIN